MGSEKQLEDAVRQKRVIRAMKKGMEIFYFPRFEFARESMYEQNMAGLADKAGEMKDFEEMAEQQMGYTWDPTASLSELPDPGKQLALLGGQPAPPPLPDVSLMALASGTLCKLEGKTQ